MYTRRQWDRTVLPDEKIVNEKEKKRKKKAQFTRADAVYVDQTCCVNESGNSVQSEVPLCFIFIFHGSHGHEAVFISLTHNVKKVNPRQDVSYAQDAAPAEVLCGEPLDEVQHKLCDIAACI